MAHLLFVSVPPVLKNRENYPPRYAHDLAVGPAAHLLAMHKLFQCEAGLSSKLCGKHLLLLTFATITY